MLPLKLLQSLVHQMRRLFNHAKLSRDQVLSHIFRGHTDEGDFEIMDGPSPVQDEALQPSTTHHLDEERAQPTLNNVGPESKNDGTATPMCGYKTIHNGEDVFPLENMGEQ